MLPRWLNRFRRTLTGSAPWFAPVTGATMPARIMPFCRSWALRPCATQVGFEAGQVALRRLYRQWRADLFGRNTPGLCPYRCGYGLLCLSVVRRLLGRWRGLDCPRRKVRRSVKGYRVCGDEVWIAPQADVRLFAYPYRRGCPERREFSLMRGSGADVFGVERRISFRAALLSWRGEGAGPGVADGDNVAGHRAAEFIAGIGAVAGADDSLAATA